MKYISLTFTLVILLFSCDNSTPEGDLNILVPEEEIEIDSLIEPIVESVIEEVAPFTLNIDSFTEFPPEIDGCACYFSKTFDAFNNGDYIYMDDFAQENAFMKLAGEMTSFNVDEDVWEDDGGGMVKVSNDTYSIILTFQQVSSLDETFQKEGDLIIINADGEEISTPFFGECGC
ncbi:MAG: hypothetical protein GQ574_02755 [Crocinitomix sp.]|nr:hypothetical protein [Crocinitomix sp.]